MKKLGGVFFLALLVTFPALAGMEKVWRPLVRGTMPVGESKGAAPSADGTIRLAPAVKPLASPAAPYLWSVRIGARGEIYAAGGDSGILYKIAGGKARPEHVAKAVGVHAVLPDKKSVLIGTGPDGKVMRVVKKKTVDVFDPSEKYIWALARTGNTLYVATGSPGRVYKLPMRGGTATKVFDAGEAHVRSLAVEKGGTILAGTDGRGLLVRISPAGKAFVVYDAGRREISDIAVAKDGTVFFAAVGSEKNPVTDPKKGPKALVYRMRKDGFVEKIWDAPGAMVYSLAAAPNGDVWAATGHPGAVYVVNSDGVGRRIWEAQASQVTSLALVGDGVLAATGNPAKVVKLPWKAGTAKGEFLGDPLDAGGFSRWGHVLVDAERAGGKVAVHTRSGNTKKPDDTWSDWSKPIAGKRGAVTSPAARYLQWKVKLDGRATSKSEPVLRYLEIFYRPANRAPKVDSITVNAPGVTLRPKPRLREEGEPPGVTKPNPSRKGWESGYQSLTWKASDPDKDSLVFDVYYRALGATRWTTLKEGQLETYTTFDATAIPDGLYELRVVARDTPSNPGGEARSVERVEGPMSIDTTPPKVTNLVARNTTVTFAAEDKGGGVARAEVSIDGAPWTLVAPEDGLADEPGESFKHPLGKLARGTYTVVVRVTDRSGNAAARETKLTLR